MLSYFLRMWGKRKWKICAIWSYKRRVIVRIIIVLKKFSNQFLSCLTNAKF